jgi:ADP-heptose:LPS heptosyltransferase
VLAVARLHVGPDSFLMHAANGLGVPSVVIFGGSRTPENLGYRENTNLFVKLPCGPCWIHESQGGRCEHNMECMALITPEAVFAAVENLFEKTK